MRLIWWCASIGIARSSKKDWTSSLLRGRHERGQLSTFSARWKQNIRSQYQSSSRTSHGSTSANLSRWRASAAPCRCSTFSPTAVLTAITSCQVAKDGPILFQVCQLCNFFSQIFFHRSGETRGKVEWLWPGSNRCAQVRSFLDLANATSSTCTQCTMG